MISLDQHYSYEELIKAAEGLTGRYRENLSCECIGISHDEREIPALHLGTSEECLIITGGVHGRESINPLLLLNMVEDYCERLELERNDERSLINHLFRKFSLCVIPLLNPDGYEIAMSGFDQIRNPVLRQAMKTKEEPWAEWKYNGRGVDINRNFPSYSYTSRDGMDASASENETKALMRVFRNYPNSLGYLDFHSRGRIIYYYRNAMPITYNWKSKRVARKLQEVSGYNLGTKKDESFTKLDGGNSVNFYSEMYQKPAITIETVEDEAAFPLAVKYYRETFREIRDIPLRYLECCKR